MSSTILSCASCGKTNPSQTAFCNACGESLQGVGGGGTAIAAQLPHHLLNERYRILEQIGQGGFGSVYKAADTRIADRLVAVKEMEMRGLTAQEIAEAANSFQQEAIMLAHLHHPHLPRIYDHFSDAGRWYLVMDIIEGKTLEDYLAKAVPDPRTGKRHLTVQEVLDIGIQLCTVLEYLHSRQPPIIFRDLKPANVMRTPDRHLYLIDFGIARHFKPGQIKDTMPLGSPGYAAPEQYGKTQTTPRADIFSLGVILHQLLSGDDPTATPFLLPPLESYGDPVFSQLAPLIKQMTALDALHRPPTMAVVKEALWDITAAQTPQIAQPSPPIWGLRPQVLPPRPSINTERVSPQREQSGQAIGGQQQIFAAREQQEPQKRSKRQIPRDSSRRKFLAAWGAAGALLLTAGAIGTLWKTSASTPSITSHPIEDINAEPTQSDQPDQAQNDLRQIAYKGHTGPVLYATFSPDGQYVVSASADKTVHIFDARTSERVVLYDGHNDAVTGVAWEPQGERIVSVSRDGTAKIWGFPRGQLIDDYPGANQPINGGGPIYGVSWSSQVGRIAMTIHDYVDIIRADTWEDLGSGTGQVVMTPNAVKWAPSAPVLLYASIDHTVTTWNINSEIGSVQCSGHTNKVLAVDWSPSGNKVASGGQDNTVRVWMLPEVNRMDTVKGTSLFVYEGHTNWVQAVAWSPDGKLIASGGLDNVVHVWEANTGKLLHIYHDHTAAINSVGWDASGKYVISASDDKTVRIWSPF